ncbi:putative nodulation protein X, partial [Riemerella anatipestifer RA-YM]
TDFQSNKQLLFFSFHNAQRVIYSNFGIFLTWILGQLSIIQFWTPEFLKFFGEGSPNASLWSICVELQFYFFVPFLFFLVRKYKNYKFFIFFMFFTSSIIFNHWISHFDKNFLIYKLGFVSLSQYLFYFMLGIFFYNYWGTIRRFIEQKCIIWTSLFIFLYFLCKNHIDIDLNNYYLHSFYKIAFIILLNISILSFAFSQNNISHILLRGQDISYGIYIYHMLIINIFIQNSLSIHNNFVIILLITIIAASLSWFIIEKPILKRIRK